MESEVKKPVVLLVLDGFGLSLESRGNPVMVANTPHLSEISSYYPGTILQASGMEVGLRWGDMGNSEVGHGNLGAGQIVYQNLTRIDMAIEDETFFANEVWKKVTDHAKAHSSKIHLMGLVSNGGIHSHIDHLIVTIKAIRQTFDGMIYLHFFADGQDVAPQSALKFKEILFSQIEKPELVCIATVMGRYYAMDKNENWDRTKRAYECLTLGAGAGGTTFDGVLEQSYEMGVFDETIVPSVVKHDDGPTALIGDNDSVVFFNFRADRARQLTQAFVFDDFDKFPRQKLKNLYFVSMVAYGTEYHIDSAFPIHHIVRPLAVVLAEHGLFQLHIAETEKYAHVTYFFNGGVEEPFRYEDRILIDSPKVASYDLQPEMSAFLITDKVLQALSLGHYDFILVNYANGDMVGHTGNFKAGVRAVEVLDECIGKVVSATLALGGSVLITADHGNVEEMLNTETLVIDKEHSTNPVPLWVITPNNRRQSVGPDLQEVVPQGVLADVAPTILEMLHIPRPEAMTGMSLLKVIGSCVLPKSSN